MCIVRIIAFSDWRIQSIDRFIKFLEDLEERPDVIVYAGDDIERFNKVPASKIPKKLQKLEFNFPQINYFEKIAALSIHGLVAVAGNDDFPFLKQTIKGKNVYDVHEEPFIIGDYAFIGLEGATTRPGILLHTEDYVLNHLNSFLDKVPKKKLVIVSHSPPYKILDSALRFGKRSIGSTSLKKFIEENHKRIEYVFCGHCHFQGGKSESYKSVSVFNCASHDNKGAPGRVAEIFISPKRRSYGFRKLYDFETEELLAINSVGPKRAQALIDADITDIKKLANANLDDQRFSTSLFKGQFGLMVNQAKAIIENKIKIVKQHSFFKDLDKKNVYFFDSEYNTLPNVNVGIFLLGWMDVDGNYQQLFIDDPKNEKEFLVKFRNWVKQVDPILVCYNSKGADRPQLIKNFEKFGMSTNLLSNDRFFDLYRDCISTQRRKDQCIYLPIKGTIGLKDVSDYLGYKEPKLDIQDGFQAISNYIIYLDEKTKKKKEKIRKNLLEYHKSDLEQTKFIFERLKELLLNLRSKKKN